MPASYQMPPPPENITVAQFGAIPNDGKDDTHAFLDAIAACLNYDCHRLVLPKGQYEISEQALAITPKKALYFEGFNGLTIDGNGSTLMFKGRVNALQFVRCKEILLKNLTIDWGRPYFSQGRVLEAHDLTCEIEIDKEYPVTGEEKFEAMMDYDPVSRFPIGNIDVLANSGIASCQLIRPQVLRIQLRTPSDPKQEAHFRKTFETLKGKLMVLRHIVYGNYGFTAEECKNLSLEDFSIYTAAGMGIHAAQVENISLKRVAVRIRPGSGRLMSTTADCQYYTHCKGTITIEDCYFEGMGDDGLNICAKYKTITKILTPTTFESLVEGGTWRGPTPDPGAKIEIVDSKSLALRGVVTVKKSRWDPSAKVFVTEITESLPSGVTVKDFMADQSYLPKARVLRSTFKGMRARALLFSTRDILVEDCKIEAPAFSGIILMAGKRSAFQGPAVSNIIIRNNTFDGCGGTAIYADASVPEPGGVHQQIVIEGNTIRENPALAALRFKKDHPRWVYWNSALCLTAVANVTLHNNKISGYPTALFFDRASHIQITDNQFKEPSLMLTCEGRTSAIQLKNNSGLTEKSNGLEYDSTINYVNIFR